jgi:hypothetical protein
LTASLSGQAWAQEWGRLPQREQVTRGAGSRSGKGAAELNRPRQEQGQAPVADPLDHFHVLREGGRGVGRAERAAPRAPLALVKAEAEMAHRRRQGLALTGLSNRVRALPVQADKARAVWVERAAAWPKVKGAVQLLTPEGELNTPARAAAVRAEAFLAERGALLGRAPGVTRTPTARTVHAQKDGMRKSRPATDAPEGRDEKTASARIG